MVGVHVAEVGPHGGDLSQGVPFADVFMIGGSAAAGGLDVDDGDAAGFVIEAGVVVFDFEVAFEFGLGPEDHVMGVFFVFGPGGEGHAFRAVGDGSDFSIEEPLFFPVGGAGVGEGFLPGVGGGFGEGGLVRCGFLGVEI